ncbi:hypothetical protein O7626_40115 [Micromonospora sp. WMMD1102]|uniref:hypothetical protein n=1 Tax=Micromonospora sp. WMMD1102 TaxID=3016105 RepID=UPI0024151C23|nr:hypothetical protein [Micromonospora sp. WMMD1102]MDG4792023.1 hypothetical protein [Micromonospora sp. WMMD1102]
MSEWWQLALAAVGGGGLAGVVTSLVAGLFQRPKVKADAMSILTDAALKQVNELQERTAEAEQRAAEAERKCRVVSSELDDMLARMRAWRVEILADPTASDRLRQMVSVDPGQPMNGRPGR